MENYNKNTMKKSKAESNHTSNENDDYHDSANDISTYDAVIAMGGDGILSEILTGLRARNDYDVLMNTFKFGIVGCGTSNGLAASLLYADKVSVPFHFICMQNLHVIHLKLLFWINIFVLIITSL
jgi:diacylglycerol kinase family enzyme